MNIAVHSAEEPPIDIPVRIGEARSFLVPVNLHEAEMQEAWAMTAQINDENADVILENILWLRANKDLAKYYAD